MNTRPPVQGLGLGPDSVVSGPGAGGRVGQGLGTHCCLQLQARGGTGPSGGSEGSRLWSPHGCCLSRPLWGTPMFTAELPRPPHTC